MSFKFSDVNIKRLQEADAILKSSIDITEKDIEVVKVLTGLDDEGFDNLSIEQFNAIRKQMYEVLNGVGDKLSPVRVFKVGTRIFTVNLNIKELKASTLRDMQILGVTDSNYIEKMHYILGLFTTEKQPIWCKWRKDLTYEEKVALFQEKLKAEIGLCLSLFFCEVYRKLFPAIQTYLKANLSKMRTELDHSLDEILKASQNTGGGTSRFTS